MQPTPPTKEIPYLQKADKNLCSLLLNHNISPKQHRQERTKLAHNVTLTHGLEYRESVMGF